jgi:hypothetical protein
MKTMVRMAAILAIFTFSRPCFAENPQFPLDVACILSMKKVSPVNQPPIETLARSCSDFVVTNSGELNLVTKTCRLSSVFQGWAHKVVYSKCDVPAAYAACRVANVKTLNEFTETYYYLSSPSPNTDSEAKLFEQSCTTMNGEFALTNQH